MAKAINSNIIRLIIAESLKSALNEMGIPPEQIGANGPIPIRPTMDLISDIPQETLSIIDDENKKISKKEFNDYFGGTKILEVYNLYEEAITGPYKTYMARRQNWEALHPGQTYNGKVVEERKAVSFFLFLKRLRNGWKGNPMYYFEFNGSYVIGVKLNNVFLTVYFCPTASSKFAITEEMCKYDNVVFSVTDDMSRILTMLGLHKSTDKVDCKFRGKFHKKDVFATSEEALQKGIEIIGLTNGDKVTAATKITQMQASDANNDGQSSTSLASILADPQASNLLKKNPQIINYFKANPSAIQTVLQNKDILIGMLSNPMSQGLIKNHPDKIGALINGLTNGNRG